MPGRRARQKRQEVEAVFEDDKPRKKIKRRGDDPRLDLLAAELAKESGDPLFVENGRPDEGGAGPGVIVAGGLNEAKAHVHGIRPPARPGAKGSSGPAEEKRVVLAAEAEAAERQQKTLETIAPIVEATQAAAKRGIESARREEAERKAARRGIEGARKEGAERETASRAGVAAGSTDGRRRAILLGGAVFLVVSVLSAGMVGFILGRKGGEEPPAPNSSARAGPLETAILLVSAPPSAAPISEPAPASPVFSVAPTEAPSSAVMPTAMGSGAARKVPVSPKPRDQGDDSNGALPAAPKVLTPEPKASAEEAPVAPGSLEFLK